MKHAFPSHLSIEQKLALAHKVILAERGRAVLNAVRRGHLGVAVYATRVPSAYGWPRQCEVMLIEPGRPVTIKTHKVLPNSRHTEITDAQQFRARIVAAQLRRLARRMGLNAPASWPAGLMAALRRVKISRISATVVIDSGLRSPSSIAVRWRGPQKSAHGSKLHAMMRLVCQSDWWARGPIAGYQVTQWICAGGPLDWIASVDPDELAKITAMLASGDEPVVRLAAAL